MAQPAQVFARWCKGFFPWHSSAGAACVAASLLLAGCGARGFSIEDAVPDRSIVTGSVSPSADSAATDPTALSDEATIRNAVSSAAIDEVGESGIGWANVGTGSRGTIRDVVESRDEGYLCRRFTASRESFEGVHLYRGETCLGASRIWVMRAFARDE